jgi:hypothetical protein
LAALISSQSAKSFAREVLVKACADVTASQIERHVNQLIATVSDRFSRMLSYQRVVLVSSARTRDGATTMKAKLKSLQASCGAELGWEIVLDVAQATNGQWAVLVTFPDDVQLKDVQAIASCFQNSPMISGKCLVEAADSYELSTEG